MRAARSTQLEVLFLAALTLAGAGAVLGGCEGPRVQIHHTLTATVALQQAQALDIGSVLPLLVLGEPGRTSALVVFDGTVTASSSSVAHSLAEKLKFEIDRSTPDKTTLAFRASGSNGILAGLLTVHVPPALMIHGQTLTGVAEVRGVTGPVALSTPQGAKISDAQADVLLEVQDGPAIVDTRALPGTSIIVNVVAGDIELDLPSAVSIAIDAQIDGSGGTIAIEHPGLPKLLGFNQTHYAANVSGGLSQARLHTQSGRILIRTRASVP